MLRTVAEDPSDLGRRGRGTAKGNNHARNRNGPNNVIDLPSAGPVEA